MALGRMTKELAEARVNRSAAVARLVAEGYRRVPRTIYRIKTKHEVAENESTRIQGFCRQRPRAPAEGERQYSVSSKLSFAHHSPRPGQGYSKHLEGWTSVTRANARCSPGVTNPAGSPRRNPQ